MGLLEVGLHRLVAEPPPWDFVEIVAGAAARSSTMLDMGDRWR